MLGNFLFLFQGATNLARSLVTNGLSPSSLVIHDPEEKYSNEYLQKVDEEVDKILVVSTLSIHSFSKRNHWPNTANKRRNLNPVFK